MDNGCQPTSLSFREHIAVSDTRLAYIGIGQPEHNAFIERYFRSLKEEEVWPTIYETVDEARQAIRDYVRFHNEDRVRSARDYLTPTDFHRREMARLAPPNAA